MDPIQRLFSKDGLCTHFPPWPMNCLSSVYNVFFDMWWTHWYTLFKISLWQTRYKVLKGTVRFILLNLEQMTSWVSCQLSFLFSTFCFYNLWGRIKLCTMDKVILSSNRRQLECVFKDTSNLSNVCFPNTDSLLLLINTRSPMDFLNFCSRSVLVNIRHTGASSERLLMTVQSYIP